MDAEQAYLFRHAMIREAAYGLQLPSDRARLHELAVRLIELLFGGPAPELAALDDFHAPKPQPLPIDTIAADLAAHARLACEGVDSPSPDMLRARLHYVHRAAEHADTAFLPLVAAAHWHELSAALEGTARAAALRRAAVACDAGGQPARALELIESALEALQQAPGGVAEAFVLGARANLRIMQAQRQEACEDYERALALFQAAGDRAGVASTSSSLGLALSRAGQPERGEALLRDALAIQRDIGDLRGQGITLGSLAGLLDDRGEARLALEHHREALQLHRRAGNRRFEGIALGNFALSLQRSGNEAEALAAYQQALVIHREVGNQRSAAIVIGNRANLFAQAGQPDRARADYQAAIAVSRELGNHSYEAIATENLALLVRDAGDLEQAESLLRQALAVHIEIGNARNQGTACWHLAALCQAKGDAAQADEYFRRALALHEQARNPLALAETRCDYGLFRLERGDAEAARQGWTQGMELLQTLNQPDIAAEHLQFMHQACAKAGVQPFAAP